MLIRKFMEFRKAAQLLLELQTEKLIESLEDHGNIRKARQMFKGPDEGEVNILNLTVRLCELRSQIDSFSHTKKYHVGLYRMIIQILFRS